ncbi:transcriptional regulator [Microbispora sp. RL4-1S]|uniref:Transcriptional regulator n=1 Tax=Microbispora oryzae TaxID=2806554 RepID=A0A941AGL7_9ACTN|nr:GAF domain-containing protein [Microbispora oryzae]MBP2703136.1 transcriptional regulator [Microbispora oryzae]
MTNPWLALEPGADAARRTRELRRAHERFLSAGSIAGPVRPVVADSWRRSARWVDPDGLAPVERADAELDEHRERHPLAQVMPLFRELLGPIADDGRHLLAVCDAEGRLLWVEGRQGVRARAERMNFVPGARWDEPHAGTNAPGVALAVDHPVQIFAAEHFSVPVQPWTCCAAPVHDPRTGLLLGAVDVTGGDHLASPYSLGLVQAAARAAETHLATLPAPATASVTLSALGRDDAVLSLGPRRIRLGHRHSEIVVLLASHPEGLDSDRLSFELYGDRRLKPVTPRAELSRLRHRLGPLLDSRPYRLRTPVLADFQTLSDHLAAGDAAAALAAYRGPLLPSSEAPGVVRQRGLIDDRLRDLLISSRDPVLLRRWVRTPWGADDLFAWQALLGATAPGSPLLPRVARRVAELDAELGLPPG